MVVLLNCSFRGENSHSNYFLGLLEQQIGEQCERLHLGRLKDFDEIYSKFAIADAVVFGMPLYADSVPAQVVDLMERFYTRKSEELKGLHIYAVTNLGFYESRQMELELAIIKNWCEKMEMVYGGSLAIGAGEMMGGLSYVPIDQGPNKEMGEGMKKLAAHIKEGSVTEDIYTEPTGFPRNMYLLAAKMNWGPQAKKNGLKKKDLYRRMPNV